MTAERTFTFGTYTLRPADQRDMALAVKWTAADADHADRTRPEFWTEQRIDRDSYMLEDAEGPLFFFKLHRVSLHGIEMHTQFPPQEDEHTRRRVQQGIMQGFNWLEETLKTSSKIQEIFFDTRHQPLRAFATRRLGFSIFKDDGKETRLKKEIGGQ